MMMKKIVSVVIGSVFFVFFAQSAFAASLSLSPASAEKNVGDSFPVDIVLDTQGVAVNGATAIISYDTEKLQVTDDDSSLTGVNISAGPNLTQVLTNSVDPSAGEIRYDAGNLGASYTGRGVIGTIHFKALSEGLAQVSFVFDSTTTTGTSAVAAASGPDSLLTKVDEANFTILTEGATTTTLPATGAFEDTLLLLAGGGMFLGAGLFFARKALRY